MFDFVFLDLETTGTNPKQDKIIEVGMIIRLKNGEREIFESLVKPGLPVPSFVKRLTGIDDEMLKEAPALEDIKPTLLKLLENRVLVAHNAIFDVAFLERALGIEIAQKSLDTLELCRLIYPQFNSYQLRNLAREFSLEPGNSHRALADALLLEKLFDHLYGELKKLSLQALEDIEAIFGDSEEMLALLCRQALRERVRMYDFTQPLNGKRQDEEAHKPSRAIGWNLQAVEKMFLPGGCVARGLKVYQHRDQQVKMLKAVGKAFQQNRHLLVEAGTGIGKSLAYLVPAIHWAVAQGEKVVVATHTIALQEQLIKSDIVFLQKNLDTAFKAAVLKGRSNYLCLFKWRTIKQNVQAFNWPEKVLMARISLWLKQNHTGDRDHINLREWEVDLYQQLSSQSENCLGQDCPFVRECFYQEAKKKAQAADVIIVNHSLLLADLKLGENILPPYQYLIVDEAHHLEEEGTKQFSEVFSLREFIKKLANLTTRRDLATRSGVLYYWKRHFSTRRDRDERLSAEMLDCISRAEALSKKINATADEIKEYCLSLEPLDTIRIQAGTTSEKWWCALGLLFDNLMLETAGILDCLKQLLNGINMEADAEETAPLRALGTLYSQLKENHDMVRTFFNPEQRPQSVYWLEKDLKKQDLCFYITPLKTGQLFHDLLFAAKSSVVMTSATLSVEGSFSYLIEQMGIPVELVDTLELPSPFYYDEQALLLIDDSLPDPTRATEGDYNLAVAKALLTYLKVTKGNTLVLFTSHRQLRFMYEELYEPLKHLGLELYADGINGRRHTLVNEMKNNPRAVVFGANTFWEGIDLPGEALTSLVIVRLPFMPPNLPLVEARLEEIAKEGKSGFFHYSLPLAVLRFRQGYGRLIRTIDDCGVVIVLDNRLVAKNYGKTFLKSLPNQKYYAGNTLSLVERIEKWGAG